MISDSGLLFGPPCRPTGPLGIECRFYLDSLKVYMYLQQFAINIIQQCAEIWLMCASKLIS